MAQPPSSKANETPATDATAKAGARKPELPKRDAAAATKPNGPLATAAAAARAQLPAAPPVAASSAEQARNIPSPQPARNPAVAGKKLATPARPSVDMTAKGKRAPTPAAAFAAPAGQTTDTPSVLPLEAAVDAAMAALVDGSTTQSGADATNDNAHDQRAVAETFSDMARVHAHPLRELMFQLSASRTPRQWAAASRPVLRSLLDAATQIGLLELVGALGAFDAALERAAAEPSSHIGDAARESLQSAYERLQKHMPEAFAAPDHADSRRLILLESLLLQVPSLHRRTLAKLYAAGLTSLSQLSEARPDEISAVAGIDRELAQAIVEHIQRFERDQHRANPAALRAQIQERLRTIVARLAQLQADFERAEQEDSTDRKRAARRGREAAVLELDLLFAEVGDVDLIEELKRCPVRGKIQRVESYLEQLQASL